MNKNLFSHYILDVKIKNEYKDLSADSVREFKSIFQRWSRAVGLENEIQHQHNFLQDFFDKWYNMKTDDFFAEVAKQNKNLSLGQKSQWLEYFEEQKQKALALQSQITKTDAEIDQMVYPLYGLSNEEIGIVEGGVIN